MRSWCESNPQRYTQTVCVCMGYLCAFLEQCAVLYVDGARSWKWLKAYHSLCIKQFFSQQLFSAC